MDEVCDSLGASHSLASRGGQDDFMAFPTFHFDDWAHCFIFGFLSLSRSCGDWDLGQAFGIPSLIPVKSGFSYGVWEGEEGLPAGWRQ